MSLREKLAEQDSRKRSPPGDPRKSAASDGDSGAKSTLAHELRTPLAAIHSLADVIAEERFGPGAGDRYQSYAVSIRDAASHLLAVIERMLAVSGPAEGGRVAELHALDLGAAARAVHLLLLEMAGRRNAAISLDLAPELPWVLADPTSVRQMLLNLASNALRHSGLGANIVLRTGRGSDGCVWIEVEDDGPGLPAEIARALGAGEPAAPAIAGRNAARSGDGRLGLPLTRAMARANGASLTFAGAAPTGTRARIMFPAGRLLPSS